MTVCGLFAGSELGGQGLTRVSVSAVPLGGEVVTNWLSLLLDPRRNGSAMPDLTAAAPAAESTPDVPAPARQRSVVGACGQI
jgi:hypothetical protein